MITPAEIIKKAERKYRDALRAHLSGDDLFPMDFPAGKPPLKLAKRRQEIDALRERAKETTGSGYSLEWKTLNKRDLGQQTVPRRVIIETLDDYLALVRKRTEFDGFAADVAKIRRLAPSLTEWMQARPHYVVEHHGKWDDLLAVCDYFVKHPRPGVYLRELPISVHTKFIEEHTRILRDLLDVLLPPDAIASNETDFVRRYGLKDKPTLVRLRLLEEQLDWHYGLRVDDLSLPVGQAAHLLAQHIKPRHVIIAENLINFLTIPTHANSVALFGGGFAVHLLRDVPWLAECDVIYWGDVDAHGFQMLSDLRGIYPHVRSVMMDMQTLNDNRDYVQTDQQAPKTRYKHLAEAEQRAAASVLEGNLRLEQEHIPHAYAVVQLKQALRSTSP